jgi:hypothetical protein
MAGLKSNTVIKTKRDYSKYLSFKIVKANSIIKDGTRFKQTITVLNSNGVEVSIQMSASDVDNKNKYLIGPKEDFSTYRLLKSPEKDSTGFYHLVISKSSNNIEDLI